VFGTKSEIKVLSAHDFGKSQLSSYKAPQGLPVTQIKIKGDQLLVSHFGGLLVCLRIQPATFDLIKTAEHQF